LNKKFEGLETQVKQIEKDQIKFAVGDDDLKDRLEKMEKKVKDLN
jgi:septal ring factor EnvC (AmiA/AmiB activator)